MITTINPINDPRWLNFISNHPDSTIFHHPDWLNVLQKQYRYNVFAICVIDENDEIKAGIPFCETRTITMQKKWISLPFSDMCFPLFHDDKALNKLIDYLSKRKGNNSIPEVEIHGHLNNEHRSYQKLSFIWHTIRLSNDSSSIYKTFSKSRVREPIVQASKRGVTVSLCNNKSELMLFYNLLIDTRKRLGVPVQPKNFFNLFWDNLIKYKLGFILLAYKENKIIAGVVCIHYNGILTVKYHASDPKYWNLRANNLLYWEAIKWGCENGFKIFDFGRTEIENKNLRDFKKGWGAEETPLYYSYLPVSPTNKNFKYLSKNIVGPLIKHSPSFVCRWIGELFYRYFA